MSIKKILAPLDGTDTSMNKLPTALLVAQRFNAHIEVLYMRRDPQESMPFVFGALSSARLRDTVMEAARQGMHEQISQMRQRFDEFCRQYHLPLVERPAEAEGRGVTVSWKEADDDELIRHCHLTDLITVVRTPQDAQPLLLESILLKTGRPVLLAPPQAPATLGNHIAIGWNDSAEAIQAVTGALPLLQQAANITIMTAQKRLDSAERLAEYLAWHGLQAAPHVLKSAGTRASIGAALLAEAKAVAADLYVIGAYSRTRASQILFGGVTQHFLAHADIPVLLAH
jgi:nucleotide-binding universal stress UspA family protein